MGTYPYCLCRVLRLTVTDTESPRLEIHTTLGANPTHSSSISENNCCLRFRVLIRRGTWPPRCLTTPYH